MNSPILATLLSTADDQISAQITPGAESSVIHATLHGAAADLISAQIALGTECSLIAVLAEEPGGPIVAVVSDVAIPINGGASEWEALVMAAEAAAQVGGISIWFIPPESYAARATYGPFANSDGSGGVPAYNAPVGFLFDRKVA